jgi:hypothetical protein
MSMPSQQEYEQNELRAARRHEQQIDAAPLSDRKDAQREFLEAMRDNPAVVGERIGWLIDGNYGYGAMLKAKQIVASPRMNRRAALVQSIAVFEWMCPRRMAVDARKKLTPQQKKLLDDVVDVVIAEAEKEAD